MRMSVLVVMRNRLVVVAVRSPGEAAASVGGGGTAKEVPLSAPTEKTRQRPLTCKASQPIDATPTGRNESCDGADADPSGATGGVVAGWLAGWWLLLLLLLLLLLRCCRRRRHWGGRVRQETVVVPHGDDASRSAFRSNGTAAAAADSERSEPSSRRPRAMASAAVSGRSRTARGLGVPPAASCHPHSDHRFEVSSAAAAVATPPPSSSLPSLPSLSSSLSSNLGSAMNRSESSWTHCRRSTNEEEGGRRRRRRGRGRGRRGQVVRRDSGILSSPSQSGVGVR